MDDLISREAVLAAINSWPEAVIYRDWVQSAIAHVPAVDAAPVVHGRWVSTDGIVWCNQCSLCGSRARIMHNYCPSCGARMDLPEREEARDDG